ncbi:MAG: YfcE family phosphodiesterase [Archaeoglobaceae archaeon]
MKFVAVSDTHDNLAALADLMDVLKNERFEFLVHAGDVISPFTIREFTKLGVKCYFAFGNNDGERKLLTKICEENGWEIGEIVEFPGGVAYHGTDARILKVLSRLDCIVVCGHTHEARVEREKALIINPGEVCGYLTGRRSFAIVEDGDVSIVEF